MAYLGGDLVAGQSPVFAKATDDERYLVLGDLGVFAVRPEALRVELLERLPCQIEPALAGRGVAGSQGVFCLVHSGNLPQPGASQQAVCGLGFHSIFRVSHCTVRVASILSLLRGGSLFRAVFFGRNERRWVRSGFGFLHGIRDATRCSDSARASATRRGRPLNNGQANAVKPRPGPGGGTLFGSARWAAGNRSEEHTSELQSL